jgi:pyruvate kinase
MLRTKIVCTIGPASRSIEMLREMIISGLNVARLNFSHGDHDYHAENIANIRQASFDACVPVAILTDLQGPKLRVGEMSGEGVTLREGEEVVLTVRPVVGHGTEIPVQYQSLPTLVESGDRILFDDGLLEVVVLEAGESDIRCKVIVGGLLESNKGLNLPRAHSSIPALSDKDKKDLDFALQQQVDWIALSFVRNAYEVVALQELIRRQSAFGRPTPVIAKIEKPEAMQNIDAIIAAADGIMVARGDLGIEALPEEVPLMQKQIIQKCNEAGIPVITATQMLDSMIRNPRPTRAEASDVANAVLDGSDAIMLSGETAVGQYPLRALRTMVRIAERTEVELQHRITFASSTRHSGQGIAVAVSHAARETAQELDAAAIITPTVSGHTARMVSRYRPTVPIVAVTPSPMVQRQLCLYWGVYPLLAKRTSSTDEMLADAVAAARDAGLVEPGQVVVVTGGAAGSAPGTTDLIKVQVVERILTTGQGIGVEPAQGHVRLLEKPLPRPEEIAGTDVLVVQSTGREHVPLAKRAAGIIVVDGGMESHAARMALELGLTAIVGATDALSALHEGASVTLDPQSGRVYEGRVRRGSFAAACEKMIE